MIPRTKSPRPQSPEPTTAANLILAIQDALHYHRKFEPPKPTSPDLGPWKRRHLWEDRDATLRHLLADLEEMGERIYE